MPKHQNDLVIRVSPEALRTAALAAISGLLELDQDELVEAMLPRLRRWIAAAILR